jgi:hypothetical protein
MQHILQKKGNSRVNSSSSSSTAATADFLPTNVEAATADLLLTNAHEANE